jgi:isopenicillin-N N-acyltransferase like protein
MAKREAGATLPVLRARGTHEDLGRLMGEFRAEQIRKAVTATKAALWDADIDRAVLAAQNGPFVEAAERIYPQYLRELRAMADGADVPFEVLFRLNCYESRPPGTPPGSVAGPVVPRAEETEQAQPAVKDPGVLTEANTDAALPSHNGAAHADVAAVGGRAPDGCTSVVSRGQGTVVVGHTEDSSPEAVEGIYLLDAEVVEDGEVRSRYLALNYAQTLPGCAAALNRHGLMVLIDALPDPERRVGAPRHFVSRALLDARSIDEAIGILRDTERGGGWNYLLVQGERYANVETTATKVAVTEAGEAGTYAHSNHYLDGALAEAAGEPRANSLARLARAQALGQPGLSLDAMKRLLSDREGYPDSICRDRTIAAWVADAAARTVEVCWGEPEGATWTRYAL